MFSTEIFTRQIRDHLHITRNHFSYMGGWTFQSPTVKSSVVHAVYIKMDAPDQLLLSEIVCRQLEIVTYHDSVEEWRGTG